MTTLNLGIDGRVKFAGDRYWWTVRAVDERFAVLTRFTPFQDARTLTYTIIDAERGVRGPCNLIGQGWDFDVDDLEAGAGELLAALNREIEWRAFTARDHAENGTTSWVTPREPMVEVSYRNNVPIRIEKVA